MRNSFACLSILYFSASLLLPANPAFSQERISKIISSAGAEIGEVKLRQGTEGVLINIRAKDLPPGFHGMHFHSAADCSDHHSMFKLALGHVDPHKKPHGFLNPAGPHEGNLPNLVVGPNGKAQVELYSQMISLKSGEANLLDQDGSALIIHANQDDHTSQPIGGSGDRIACAEIR